MIVVRGRLLPSTPSVTQKIVKISIIIGLASRKCEFTILINDMIQLQLSYYKNRLFRNGNLDECQSNYKFIR